MNNKNFIVAFLILVIIAIIALGAYLPSRTDAALRVRVADFPKTIGEWQGEDLPIPDLTYKILETKNLFVREYNRHNSNPVYLFIVYSEDNRKVSHPPEVCLMGGGMTITDKSPMQVTNYIKGTKLIVEKQDSRELVVYWYKAGDLNTDKYLRQQLKVVMDRTFGKRTSGALIKISTEVKLDKQDEALKLLKSFANEIEPLLAKYVP